MLTTANAPLVGATAWLVWALAVRPHWTAVLLLLSPFVLVPLGLRLAARPDTGPDAPALRALALWAPAVAATAAGSFIPGPGSLAAVLSLPWLGFTTMVAAAGIGRLLSRRLLRDAGIGVDAGLIFVAVGGVWLTISRAGFNPLGFSDAIVELTAVHFHYAGFALPVVAGFAARHLSSSLLVPAAVIVTVPLTAIGITAGEWLKWFAANAMALAGLSTATFLARLAARQSGAGRWFVGIAAVALAGGMALALGWSWSTRFGWEYLGLDAMAAIHGSLNALGFGVVGLIALNTLPPAATLDKYSVNIHPGRPTREHLKHLVHLAESRDTTNAAGLLEAPTPAGFRRKEWNHTIRHGNFAAASEALQQWAGHRSAGINLWPLRPDIEIGQTLALAIPVGPISVSATCRIVKVIDEPDRYGFTYSTLPHHPEDGEESFIVATQLDGNLDVSVTAVWRPATLGNHVCPPFTRFLQNRAITRYLNGIAASPHQETSTP